MRVQAPRLLYRWSSAEIGVIDQEFQELQWAYNRESSFKTVMDACDRHTSFEYGWKLAQDRFLTLREFCGGLATAFPGTLTVERDFSIVKWEKDNSRVSLTYFSLEGILRANQFKGIRAIKFLKIHDWDVKFCETGPFVCVLYGNRI